MPLSPALRRICLVLTLAVAGGAAPTAASSAPAAGQDEGMRGIVRAVDEAWISSELGFRIEALPLREGEDFRAGDVLARFNCEGLKSELASAEARLRAERLTLENNRRLAKARAAGRFEVALSEAKTDQAEGEVGAYLAKLGQCEIKAPFDGRVALLRAHAHEIPDRTQPLMQIVGTKELEIDLLLPAAWVRWLAPRTRFEIAVEETGRTVEAEVARVAAVVDPVSQTVKVIARFTGDAAGVLPGMSGPALFKLPNG